jgi:hypothetical protein
MPPISLRPLSTSTLPQISPHGCCRQRHNPSSPRDVTLAAVRVRPRARDWAGSKELLQEVCSRRWRYDTWKGSRVIRDMPLAVADFGRLNDESDYGREGNVTGGAWEGCSCSGRCRGWLLRLLLLGTFACVICCSNGALKCYPLAQVASTSGPKALRRGTKQCGLSK